MTPGRIMTPRGYWREVPAWERRRMTVCIAAVADDTTATPRLVLCSDWKVSGPLGSLEWKYKQEKLGTSWRCMVAGKESEVSAALLKLKPSFDSAVAIDETNLTKTVRDALNARKKAK